MMVSAVNNVTASVFWLLLKFTLLALLASAGSGAPVYQGF
jgi:hypothetical protein